MNVKHDTMMVVVHFLFHVPVQFHGISTRCSFKITLQNNVQLSGFKRSCGPSKSTVMRSVLPFW